MLDTWQCFIPDHTILLGGFVSVTGWNRINEEINQHLLILRDEYSRRRMLWHGMGKREEWEQTWEYQKTKE